jgi:hypothetical protein
MRATAWVVVAAGVAAPLARRRLRLRPAAVLAAAAAAPPALCVVVPRSRSRDVGVCLLQMWAYLAAYEMPHDDPEALARRVRIDYPIRIDCAIGAGEPPSRRLQRLFSRPGELNGFEKVLVWTHWLWFFVPHGTVAYVLLAHRERFERAATLTYAVFDLGVTTYWAIPTAPPWYAAAHGHMDEWADPRVRRMMIEYGEQFWKDRWTGLYDLLAGNPLAAMPSLHFATSVMAAHLLTEIGPLHGALAWSYTLTLGLALVYLGEHYVADLVAGLALTETIRAAEPSVAPIARAVSGALQALEARAAT